MQNHERELDLMEELDLMKLKLLKQNLIKDIISTSGRLDTKRKLEAIKILNSDNVILIGLYCSSYTIGGGKRIFGNMVLYRYFFNKPECFNLILGVNKGTVTSYEIKRDSDRIEYKDLGYIHPANSEINSLLELSLKEIIEIYNT